jgi:hypothetical protein
MRQKSGPQWTRRWEESGFEPLVTPATEMLIELAKEITHATRMLAVGDDRAGAAIALTLKWGPAVSKPLSSQRGVHCEPRVSAARGWESANRYSATPTTEPACREHGRPATPFPATALESAKCATYHPRRR